MGTVKAAVMTATEVLEASRQHRELPRAAGGLVCRLLSTLNVHHLITYSVLTTINLPPSPPLAASFGKTWNLHDPIL
jgi:hypothetical protein